LTSIPNPEPVQPAPLRWVSSEQLQAAMELPERRFVAVIRRILRDWLPPPVREQARLARGPSALRTGGPRQVNRDPVRLRLVVVLSDLTKQHAAALFPASDVAAVERLLVAECADNLPLVANAPPAGLERLRFAALRFSGGRLDRLAEAVALAKKDWRDLLMASGFGHDPLAHRSWQPRRFEADLVDHWMKGDLPADVAFGRGAAVQVRFGRRMGKRGAVVALTGIEPEAQYGVQLVDGETVELYQRALIRAD